MLVITMFQIIHFFLLFNTTHVEHSIHTVHKGRLRFHNTDIRFLPARPLRGNTCNYFL
jgi:hypothetical protein